MADIYVDLSLSTGSNDGSDWANAYQGTNGFISAASASSAGDKIYVKGTDTSLAVNITITFPGTDANNPVEVLSCKSGTTAEPPANSDLTDGLRTGNSTRAYDNSPAHIGFASANDDINIRGYANIYGMLLAPTRNFSVAQSSVASGVKFEECKLTFGAEFNHGFSGSPLGGLSEFTNCELQSLDASANLEFRRGGTAVFLGCAFTRDDTFTPTILALGENHFAGRVQFIGCDFTDYPATDLVDCTNIGSGTVEFWNCSVASGQSLVTGTAVETTSCKFIGLDDVTGKSSGSIRESLVFTHQGEVASETTAIRTGGADDGASGGYSWALTPIINGTRDNLHALKTDWMAVWIEGDGTSKTIEVPIANSGSGDYDDDEVWLEAMFPSAGGTAQWDFATNQMDLLDTPSTISDDAVSVWGTGAGNGQTLSLSVAPDYEGLLYVRACFAKNFGSSPETLYVDPLPIVT